MNPRSYLSACLLAALLAGCNDDGENQSQGVTKHGYGERELYNPVEHPAGALLPQGSTAVLQLEAAASGSSRPDGDTGGLGYDEVWFDWNESAPLGLGLEPDELQVIARLELREQTGALRAAVDSNQPYTEVELPAGRYQLLVHAAHHESRAISVFIGYTLQPQASGGRGWADPMQVRVLRATKTCSWCNLSGVNLAGVNMFKAHVPGSDLSRANLTGTNLSEAQMGSAKLSEANLSKANLSRAFLDRANLYAANLTGANLSGAKLSEAILSYADLTGADLSGADLSGARLGLATWTDGRKCGNGSVGECR